MKEFMSKIQLEKSDYRKIKESFNNFMLEAANSIERAMIKQVPEYAELDQTREIIINNIENAMESAHFDMFQQYQHTMDKMRLIELKTYFCLGMKFDKDC